MMRRSERIQYLGAALAEIVESTAFRTIEKASGAVGHYEVNGNRRVLIRYSAAEGSPWHFTLRRRELTLLRDERLSGRRTFLCLVCRSELICMLTIGEVAKIIDLGVDTAQTIRVYSRRSASIEVRSDAALLDWKVPKHAFPGWLFHNGREPGRGAGHRGTQEAERS